jgi:hypothetical protein
MTSTEGRQVEVTDDRIAKMLQHLGCARRLRAGMKLHGNMRGLERSLRHHIGQAANLAAMLAGPACEAGPHQ